MVQLRLGWLRAVTGPVFETRYSYGEPMKRREFLKYGSASLLTLAFGGSALRLVEGGSGSAKAAAVTINLSAEEIMAEMIDGEEVFMLAFRSPSTSARVPGPVLRVREGDQITITLFNNTETPHKLEIPGVAGASSGTAAPQQSTSVTFTAPVAGTYLYLDPINAPVNRMLGLHGVMIVEPAEGRTIAGAVTPYSRATHTPAIATLFDAFGVPTGRFPGDPWHPSRELVWVFHQFDPRFHAMAERGESINASTMQRDFLARYFTINGVSGFEAAHDPSIVATGFVGQPMLIRNVNAGLNWHSPHIHGNHVFELAGTARSASEGISSPQELPLTSSPEGSVAVRKNLIHRDVWTMAPLDRKDMLIPYERPPDIPDEVRWHFAYPPAQETEQTRAPLRYVMHDHTEVSLTAGGGNYPQGMMCHWEIFPRELMGQVLI